MFIFKFSFLSRFISRLVFCVILIIIVSTLIFLSCQELPGDVARAILGQQATPEALAAIRLRLGLDQPAWMRYLAWLRGVSTGDLGTSYITGQRIASALTPRLFNTLFLASLSALIATPMSIILGLLAAIYRNNIVEKLIITVTRSTVVLPEFFVAYLFIFFFSVKLGWFDSGSFIYSGMPLSERAHEVILPALTLAVAITGHMTTMTRAALLNILSSSYFETAKLKGLPRWKIITHHALPNALSPIIGVIAVNFSYLLVGAVVVEVIFVYPGMGLYLVDSVVRRDVPVVQAVGLIFATIYIFFNQLADFVAQQSNARTRLPR